MNPDECPICDKCGEEIEDDTHLVEAFEISNGLMLCAGCFEEMCEREQK